MERGKTTAPKVEVFGGESFCWGTQTLCRKKKLSQGPLDEQRALARGSLGPAPRPRAPSQSGGHHGGEVVGLPGGRPPLLLRDRFRVEVDRDLRGRGRPAAVGRPEMPPAATEKRSLRSRENIDQGMSYIRRTGVSVAPLEISGHRIPLCVIVTK